VKKVRGEEITKKVNENVIVMNTNIRVFSDVAPCFVVDRYSFGRNLLLPSLRQQNELHEGGGS
jgi:hypothetical protein